MSYKVDIEGANAMTYIAAYVGALIVFGIIDAIWLSWAVPTLYKPMFGDALADPIRIVPASIFYFAFPVGIVIFAVAAFFAERLALDADHSSRHPVPSTKEDHVERFELAADFAPSRAGLVGLVDVFGFACGHELREGSQREFTQAAESCAIPSTIRGPRCYLKPTAVGIAHHLCSL